jgi:glycosyltransferase involved in cell wall biosynthesis
MRPFLTVIVPTIVRPSLQQTLESIAAQRRIGEVEVVIVQDIHRREPKEVDWQVLNGRAWSVRVGHHDAGFSAWGHPQRNWAMPTALGEWIATLDDDDVWTPDALDLIIEGVTDSPKTFNIFQMQHYGTGVTIWQRMYPSQGNIGTPMMVWKNGSPVGQWGDRYEGDYDFCKSTIHTLPDGMDGIYFIGAVIATIRPPVGAAA